MSTSSHTGSGDLFGRYVLEHEIGRGATSIVYAARDSATGQRVAVKVLRPELTTFVTSERFLREIRLSANLSHPNIVPLLDSGDSDGRLFCVMPLMEDGTLRQRLQAEKQLPISEVISIGQSIAQALHFAHERNLLHRDVKPENILFADGRACLADFGIARALVHATGESTTSTGIVRGTPAYMSPEQASGDPHYDARSDIYSLACVLYEALAGIQPFVGPTAAAIMAQRIAHSPRPVRVYRQSVPPELEHALERALATSPADRVRSAAEFAEMLQSIDVAAAGQTYSGSRRASVAVRRFFWRRHRVLVSALSAVALLIAGAAARRWWPHSSAPPIRPELDSRRVAVLYFDDHSADKSLGYLANGLTESLIHELTGVRGIQVISRNGVKPFRDVAVPIDSIARALRVGTLVEGSVQNSGDRVRLTVQLIDAASATHLQSTTIDRKRGELFELEDTLAQSVAAVLRRHIGAEVRLLARRNGTRSAPARELVWRADQLRDQADTLAASRDTNDLRRALALDRRADSLLAAAQRADGNWLDPLVDRGWVALDIARRYTGAIRQAAFDSSITFADRALSRDGSNPSARELRGTSLYFRANAGLVDDRRVAADLARANADLERAIEGDSSRASAWSTLSRILRARGDVADAERKAATALAMDAYLEDAPSILWALFSATLMNDSADASWRWCRRGAAEYPADVRFVTCQLTLLAEDRSRAPDVRDAKRLLVLAAQLDPPERAGVRGQPWLPIYREMTLAVVFARSGETDSARALAARAQQQVGSDTVMRVDLEYELALLDLMLGNRGGTLSHLGSYLRARPYLRDMVSRHPRWKPLATDSAFLSLVRPASLAPRN